MICSWLGGVENTTFHITHILNSQEMSQTLASASAYCFNAPINSVFSIQEWLTVRFVWRIVLEYGRIDGFDVTWRAKAHRGTNRPIEVR
jgi:hypothetical protein